MNIYLVMHFGPYTLLKREDGTYWLGHASGEGLQTTEEKLVELLSTFWNDEF